MPRLEYFVVGEFAIVDSNTNKASIINVIEEATFPTFPTVVTQEAAAICTWLVEDGDFEKDWHVNLRVKVPDNQEFEFPAEFRFLTGSRRHRLILRISGLPLMKPGDLTFELLLEGKHAAVHLVSILQDANAQPAMQAAPPAGGPPQPH